MTCDKNNPVRSVKRRLFGEEIDLCFDIQVMMCAEGISIRPK